MKNNNVTNWRDISKWGGVCEQCSKDESKLGEDIELEGQDHGSGRRDHQVHEFSNWVMTQWVQEQTKTWQLSGELELRLCQVATTGTGGVDGGVQVDQDQRRFDTYDNWFKVSDPILCLILDRIIII